MKDMVKFEAAFYEPLKKKFLRHKNNPIMTKYLRKQRMVRCKLRNI